MNKQDVENLSKTMSTEELLLNCIREYYPKCLETELIAAKANTYLESCKIIYDFEYKYGIEMRSIIEQLKRDLFKKRERKIDDYFIKYCNFVENKIPTVIPENVTTVAELEALMHERYNLPEDYERD